MTTEIPSKPCAECETPTPITLFRDDENGYRGEICPHCVADMAAKRTRDINRRRDLARAPAVEAARKLAEEMKRAAKLSAEEERRQQAERLMATRLLQRRRLLPFVEASKPTYLAGWVHKDICRRLEQFEQDVVEGKSPRLMLFMPPRHGKSQIASIDYPAWHLGRNPKHEIIACSYSASLAMGFSRKVRTQLRSPEFTAVFPACELDPEVQAAEGWQTTAGGGYVPAGVSGPITGKGAHVLVIDDPVKNREEAESANTQESIYDWYTSTAYTRLAPGGGILIIMTRWHDMDLAGRLLQAAKEGGDQWEVVCYPAIATEDEKYRLQGEALHPARYPIEALHRIRNAVGPRDWEALYQQSPVSNEGDYFKRSEMRFYSLHELKDKKLQYYATWDFAVGKKETNDYSVGLVVGIDNEDNIYIVDVWRGRWQSDELVEKILDLYEKWKPSIVGVEKGVIEMSIGPFLDKRIEERKLWEMFIEELKPGRRDKVARARAIQGRLQQGKVYFPADGPFTHTLIAEMLRFPSGEHDDQVDALAWAGHMLALFHGVKTPKEPQKESWRDKIKKLAVNNSSGKKRSAMAA